MHGRFPFRSFPSKIYARRHENKRLKQEPLIEVSCMKKIFLRVSRSSSVLAVWVAALLLVELTTGANFLWAQSTHLRELRELDHDASPPLANIPVLPPQAGASHVVPLYKTHGIFERPQAQPDPVIQSSPSGNLATSSVDNFLGLGNGFSGPQGSFLVQYIPPDTNGAVGDTQYVQWVNASFAVFDKATGNPTYGPAAGNTLWNGFNAANGACARNNSGDPIAQFDKIAKRWVLMQPVFKSPYVICVAVSQTSDATGPYYRYAFSVPSGLFPDYPKLSVWPNGYYLTYNQFQGNSFVGAAACAMDRNKMLTGAAAGMQCATIDSKYGSLLPADFDGATPPPSASPGYFLNYDENLASLDLWKMTIDWNNSNNSSFTGPANIGVASFTEACGGGACIPQAGTPQKLDSLGERLMYRLAYRNFGDHESMVVSHSVDTGTASANTGIRWYELRKTSGAFGLFQQGTYAPDSDFRWMGSIAMDKFGNIGLGYSASSGAMSPTIRYTGRAAGDAPGVMQSENELLTGITHGSQTSYARWGDYSSMTVDPVDDCTFWFTTEYQPINGNAWSTRIASFRFPSCNGATTISSVSLNPSTVVSGNSSTGTVTLSAAPAANTDIALSSSNTLVAQVPATVTVMAGAMSANFNITTSASAPTTNVNITASYGGSSQGATLSVTAPLTASSVSLNPSSVVGGNSSTGTVTLSGPAPAGGVDVALSSSNNSVAQVPSSNIVNVASGATSASFNVTTSAVTTTTGVNITATYGGASPSAVLTVNPASAGDYSISASPGNRTIKAGSSTSYTISITASGGYAGSVALTVTGGCPTIPANACSITPASIVGSGSATLTVQTSTQTQKVTYTLSISGTDNAASLSHSVTTGLKVR
jgi:hypothetical protein